MEFDPTVYCNVEKVLTEHRCTWWNDRGLSESFPEPGLRPVKPNIIAKIDATEGLTDNESILQTEEQWDETV